jgi:outer membrane protein OmpA-like peptidoglycan-associated protein/uncharacterized protein YegP (UPF0339 family)
MVHEDYLPCGRYEKQAAHSEKNFTAFFHEESERHFFALLDEDGKILLKSEGYPQPAARDNGIASVIKNRVNADFFSVKNENGKYFLSLRAANYREIARSCSVDSEAEANALLVYCTGEKIRGGVQAAAIVEEAVVEDKERANNKVDDDYLSCKEYESGANGNTDLVKFSHENGLHYFAWISDTGKVYMRSEGYPTTAARDNGIASVEKNRDLDERYSTVEKMGRYFVILKAGNHQEIARSCPYESAAAAAAFYPSARHAAPEAPVVEAIVAPEPVVEVVEAPVVEAIAPVVVAPPVVEAAPVVVDIEDDYLSCKEYEGKTVNDKVNNVALFKHENGLFYFAIYGEKGEVRLRSEGFTTAENRDSELSGALKNLSNPDAYTTLRKGEYYIQVVKDKTGREVGRSCLQKEEPKPIVIAPVVAPVAAVAAVAAVVEAPKPVVEIAKPVDIEDDYLPCKDYQGKNVSDKVNNVAMFKHDNGLYYFAIYDNEGAVRMRSEGFTTAQNRDKELSGALKNINNPDAYTVIRKGEYYIQILKDKDGKEVGRSCLQKEEPKPIVVPPVAAPIAVAAVAAVAAIPKPEPVVEKVVAPPPPPKVVVPPPPVYEAAAPIVEEAAGSKMWIWGLLGAAAIGGALWFMNRNKAEVPPPPPPVEVPAAPPVTEPAAPAATPEPAPVAAAPDCNLNWILFDFDKAAIRADANKELEDMAKILKDNKDYVGVLRAHTDAIGSSAYNDGLSNRRATNAKAVLVKLGIDGDRLKTSASGKNEAYAKNTNDDTGRKFNRRVELFIQDKNGKEVCKSIPPSVSADLKAN